MFAFDKFQQYLISNKVIVCTSHFAIKYLMAKKDAKLRLISISSLYIGVTGRRKVEKATNE